MRNAMAQLLGHKNDAECVIAIPIANSQSSSTISPSHQQTVWGMHEAVVDSPRCFQRLTCICVCQVKQFFISISSKISVFAEERTC